MKEVAVVLYHGYYDYYGYGEGVIAQSISDWQEVSDEDYALLKMFVHKMNKNETSYVLIERYPDVNGLIADHLEACRELKVRDDEAKARAAMTKQQKAEAKLAKEKEKAFELARKHGLL